MSAECIDGHRCNGCTNDSRLCRTQADEVATNYIQAIGPERSHTAKVDRSLVRAITAGSRRLNIAREIFARQVLKRVIEIRGEQNRSKNPWKYKTP